MSLQRSLSASLSSSLSSCLDSVEAVGNRSSGDDEEVFVRDGGRVGAIFLGGHHLGDRGVGRIVHELEDPCREYYKLYLCDNRIGSLGASFVSYLLKYNTTLVELSLGNNNIGDEGARHLASSLVNDTLRMLNIENNNIGAAGVAALANALERNNTSLHSLVLSENPIGDGGARAMLDCIRNNASIDSLMRCNHTLRTVTLKKVTQVNDASILRKIPAFLKINRESESSSPSVAARRKILLLVKEHPSSLLDYLSSLRCDTKEMFGCMALVLALLGGSCDASSIFLVLMNSPSVFSDDPDISRVRFKAAKLLGI